MLKVNKSEQHPNGWLLAYQWDDLVNDLHTDETVFAGRPEAHRYWATMCWYYLIQRNEQLRRVCDHLGIDVPACFENFCELDYLPMAEMMLTRVHEIDYTGQPEEFTEWFKMTIQNAISAAKELTSICKLYNLSKHGISRN